VTICESSAIKFNTFPLCRESTSSDVSLFARRIQRVSHINTMNFCAGILKHSCYESASANVDSIDDRKDEKCHGKTGGRPLGQ
jgi:hypothetical protein